MEHDEKKQLGYDPNAAIANRLGSLDCEAGEAILAIKISVSVDSEGTKLGMGVRVLGPKMEKVHSIAGGFITMAANNLACAIRDAIKPMLTESFTEPVLRDTEKEFTDAIAKGHKEDEQPKKDEEANHGV